MNGGACFFLNFNFSQAPESADIKKIERTKVGVNEINFLANIFLYPYTLSSNNYRNVPEIFWSIFQALFYKILK